jgi:hypothetical protein
MRLPLAGVRTFDGARDLALAGALVALALVVPACTERPGGPARDTGGGGSDLGAACSDMDADTLCDSVEGTTDTDGDGMPNQVDHDSDGDGVTDRDEAGDGDPRTPPADTNGDGVPDFLDPATHGGTDAGVGGVDGSLYEPDSGMIDPVLCPPASIIPTGCVAAADEGAIGACNERDDDCDLAVDEGCNCVPGAVQPCFRGPPGRRAIGACQDGMQRCVGSGEFGEWGACEGGIAPTSEACDGLDNDCNGCTDEVLGCTPMGECPGPGDPRIHPGRPFADYPLHGGDFYSGPAPMSWRWTISGGPCESILPRNSYTLSGADTEYAIFRPTLSGDYTVTMTVVQADGTTFTCTWIIHIEGPGLRVEMCYPESMSRDLDLFLSRPGYVGDWYADFDDAFQPSPDVCGWHNCEAILRGMTAGGATYARADWGYATSAITACEGGPLGPRWRMLGYCSNPRLDIDNNLVEGIGVPENINIDAPLEGERFRIMVQNFTGTIARPAVNVYCGGRLISTYGVAPDTVPGFMGMSGHVSIGAMWRVADVTTHVDGAGETTCDVEAIHPPGSSTGFDVTFNDPRF